VNDAAEGARKAGWLARLKTGLSRSTTNMSAGVERILIHRRLDDETLGELEELLISADLGPAAAAHVVSRLRGRRLPPRPQPAEIRRALAEEIASELKACEQPFAIGERRPPHHPHVALVVGVNGVGKTTTIGKLAALQRDQGNKVLLAAGDTFRAAAIEQLQIWGTRAGAAVVAREGGADPAALAFDALRQAQADGVDLLLIDTAGRLQNKTGLMDELAKIARVLKKLDDTAPHSVLLVLDATTGQNALSQIEVFRDIVAVTGLIMTKLDGTARGGVLVAACAKFGLPVHFIGIGEGLDDLQPFSALAFANALCGVGSQD
jgi:fused signal recognition particle receptor